MRLKLCSIKMKEKKRGGRERQRKKKNPETSSKGNQPQMLHKGFDSVLVLGSFPWSFGGGEERNL